MKFLRNQLPIYSIAFVLIPIFFSCDKQVGQEAITLNNGEIEMNFSNKNGSLMSFKDLASSQELLDSAVTQGSLWEIEINSNEDVKMIDATGATDFKYSLVDNGSLLLEWNNFSSVETKKLKVSVTVNLDKEDPMSNWGISLDGTSGMEIRQINFPRIQGIKDIGDEYLAAPLWLGQLVDGPREDLIVRKEKGNSARYVYGYPGPLSLQLMTFYDPNNYGLYLSANDSLAYSKSFSLSIEENNALVYEMFHYPTMDDDLDSYSTPYESVIGVFKGDWMTAAEIYRDWAEEQAWCRDSRLANDLIEPWLKETAIWVWNRTTSDKVLEPAIHLKKLSGLSVNVFWHWWHNCSYDDGFPEYLPPREGGDKFIKAMKKANDNGVNAIVYMNSFQWGTETKSWDIEGAEKYALKDINGNLRSHVYNIFTNKSLTNMCMATDFWKNKYASLSDSVVNVYKTNGVYMDQACLHRKCYDPSHDHVRGGGNYWVSNFGKLTRMIREKTSGINNAVLAGEGACEAWLPYLDAFLTLQVSMERYAGISNRKPIPFYPMVYHKYAIMYGSYSSLIVPPYDNLWPEEYAPKDPEALLGEEFNKQFYMEHARSFVWGQQPTLANYRSFLPDKRKHEIEYLINLSKVRMEALKYLLYGEMQRSPVMEIPEEEIDISRLSIYAGKEGNNVTVFKDVVPLVYSGTWRADDGSIGIAVTNINDKDYSVIMNFKASDYDLASSGEFFVVGLDGRESIGSYNDDEITVNHNLGARDMCVIEIIPE